MLPTSRLSITTLTRHAALLSTLSQPTHRAPTAPWRIDCKGRRQDRQRKECHVGAGADFEQRPGQGEISQAVLGSQQASDRSGGNRSPPPAQRWRPRGENNRGQETVLGWLHCSPSAAPRGLTFIGLTTDRRPAD